MTTQSKTDTVLARFFAEYVATGGCSCPWPDCRSADIESDTCENDENGRDTAIHCNTCGRRWVEEFRMTGVALVQGTRQVHAA